MIELERDLQYAIGLPSRLRKLGLEEKEKSKLYTEIPYVSPLLVYCSAIEVIARSYHKKEQPPKNINGEWFKRKKVSKIWHLGKTMPEESLKQAFKLFI